MALDEVPVDDEKVAKLRADLRELEEIIEEKTEMSERGVSKIGGAGVLETALSRGGPWLML